MFARCAKFVVVVALVAMTGAHWAVLQTIAWTTMLAANCGTESFSEAVSQTFDGRHLCPLCRAIAAAKQSGQKKEFTAQSVKLEFPPLSEKFVFIPPSPVSSYSSAGFFADSFLSKPPLPPPRSRFA